MNEKTLNEANGTFFMGKNLITPSNPLLDEIEMFKTQKQIEEANKLYIDLAKEKQEEINNKLQNLKMLPLGNKVLLLPYPANPYKKVMEGNIIVEWDGTFDNPDSGSKGQLAELVACAKVIEVGPDCKFLKVDDDVYYMPNTAYPIPFMSLGYKLTTEPQILCVLNTDLDTRFPTN